MSRLVKISAAVVLALFLWSLTPSAPAAEPTGLGELEKKLAEGASVADLVNYAYKTNAMIQAARHSWKGVIERYRVVIAYPDPMLTATYFTDPIETRLGPQDWNLTLSQTIPFPGKLSKAGEVVEADIQMARLEFDKTLRDVIVNIRQSYYELRYIKHAKKAVALNRDLLDHLRKVGETAYARDRATFLDVLKGQSQVAQLQYDMVLLEELEQTEKVQLNSLLNRPPGAQIKLLDGEILPPVVYKLDEIYGLASQYQEEIQMAETQINKARARIGLAKYEYLPEFRVGLFYAGIGKPDVPVQPRDAGRDAVGVQFGISIPLWFDKNAGRLEEARAEAQKAQSMKITQINNTNAQIRNLYFRLQNSERLVRLYRDQLLPQASQSLEIAETWFREKQGSFSDFVETQAVFYNFQLALARAKADYGRYLALLERVCGRGLTGSSPDQKGKKTEEGAK
ncbi:MAG: TolC family protein [Deltaproteobacteria bacterium]|nr:TolC family protein [Deltaproteobacteria bacterium]